MIFKKKDKESKPKKGKKVPVMKVGTQKKTVRDIMRTIGCSEKTARNKINGETDFTYPEAEEVRNRLFPGMRMEYLFHQPGKSA